MIFLFRLFSYLTFWVFIVASLPIAKAHVLDQVFGRLAIEGKEFNIRLIIDAGYCLPEFRGDTDIPAPDLAWIEGLNEEQHERLRKEAENYLRETLTLRQDGTQVDYSIAFRDYEQTPYKFYSSSSGAPTLRLTLNGTFLPKGGEFQASWQDPYQASLLIVFIKESAEGGGKRSVSVQLEPQTEKNLGIQIEPFQSTQSSEEPKVTITAKHTGWLGYIKIGFDHVIPAGFDHILFVVGLFLFSPKWRPLLHQSLAFTLSHSVTLALSLLGVISFEGKRVEALIALSIVYIAIENLRAKEDDKSGWKRLILVFAFGLIHGLGFGAVMRTFMPSEEVIWPLIGFNIGIELGQITVLALCFLLFVWFVKYFRWVRISGSVLIGLVGLFWFFERIFS